MNIAADDQSDEVTIGQDVDASGDENDKQQRRVRRVHQGMGFLLQSMRSHDAPTIIDTVDDVTQSILVDDEQQVQAKKRSIDNGATDDDGKQAKLDNSTSETRSPLPRPIISYDLSKVPHLCCTEQLAFADEMNNDIVGVGRVSPLIARNNYLKGCKWSPTGRYLLTTSQDRYSRTFAYSIDDNYQHTLHLNSKVPHGDLIYDFCWHPTDDDARYATTSRHHPIHMWNTSGGKRCATYRGINHLDELSSAYALCFSIDGHQLYAGYRQMIRIFDVERPGRVSRDIYTFSKLKLMLNDEKGSDGQKAIISAIAMNPAMRGVYAVACYGRAVGLYSDYTMSVDCLFDTDHSGVTHLMFASDGNRLFTGGRKDSQVICWDLRFPGQVLCRFRRPADTNQRFYFDIDSANQYLFSGSSDGHLLVWDLKTSCTFDNCDSMPTIANIKVHDSSVNGVSLHPQHALVATSSGQRVFPFPMINDSEIEDTDQPSDDDDQYNRHVRMPAELDNTIKIWSFNQVVILENTNVE